MIGVQAVSGGLLGLLVLCGIASTALAALVGGVVMVRRRRKVVGAISVTLGVAMLGGIATLLMRIFPAPLEEKIVDFNAPTHVALKEEPSRCQPVGDEEWCFLGQDVRNLVLILPDAQRRTLGASSFYSVFAGSRLKRVSFMLRPGPDHSQLLSLLTAEGRVATGDVVEASQVKNRETALRAVRANEVQASDQHVLFAHPTYKVHLWVLPRSSGAQPYGVWYEVILSDAPVSP